MDDSNTLITLGRRYIYDGWSVVEERTFDNAATLGNSPNTLERVYVNGRSIDEPLLVAIDGDGDEFLNTSKNTTNGVNIVDAEYYYLSNRLGSISAILDADNADRVLEYYRYEVFGSATVLPIVDNNTDGLEDTPLDLNDNNASGPALVSSFGNTYLYTARRFDDITGLYYYRNRYYDPRSGRFITRDPAESPQNNLYGYVGNSTTYYTDPYGLEATEVGTGVRADGWKKSETEWSACGGVSLSTRTEIANVGQYDQRVFFRFTPRKNPKDQSCCCDSIRVIQMVRVVNSKGEPYSLTNEAFNDPGTDKPWGKDKEVAERADELSKGGWRADHWPEDKDDTPAPFYTGGKDISPQEGKCPCDGTDSTEAFIYDLPRMSGKYRTPEYTVEFQTCAVCVKSGTAYSEMKVLGCINWRLRYLADKPAGRDSKAVIEITGHGTAWGTNQLEALGLHGSSPAAEGNGGGANAGNAE